MRLGSGPLRVRIEAEGPEAATLLARAKRDGLVLAEPGETAELVARPSAPAAGGPRCAEVLAEKPSLPLSPRELEILDYLVDGWSNAEIASALRIGVRTVRFHLGNIYGELGVSRRGEAVREAIRLGLVRFEF
jgi:DNA-binding CsgD family transcriptional regulator